jgi:hypothetical protein
MTEATGLPCDGCGDRFDVDELTAIGDGHPARRLCPQCAVWEGYTDRITDQ